MLSKVEGVGMGGGVSLKLVDQKFFLRNLVDQTPMVWLFIGWSKGKAMYEHEL